MSRTFTVLFLKCFTTGLRVVDASTLAFLLLFALHFLHSFCNVVICNLTELLVPILVFVHLTVPVMDIMIPIGDKSTVHRLDSLEVNHGIACPGSFDDVL